MEYAFLYVGVCLLCGMTMVWENWAIGRDLTFAKLFAVSVVAIIPLINIIWAATVMLGYMQDRDTIVILKGRRKQ